jgi:hypothetical protein
MRFSRKKVIAALTAIALAGSTFVGASVATAGPKDKGTVTIWIQG